MNNFVSRIIFAFVIIILPYGAMSTQACSCLATPTPYKAYNEAAAVFIGKAVSSKVYLMKKTSIKSSPPMTGISISLLKNHSKAQRIPRLI